MDEKIIANSILLERMRLAYASGKLFNGSRDLYDVLGYNKTPTIIDYASKYLRQDITKRIIDAYPDAVWNEPPVICEDEDMDEDTQFETQVKELIAKTKLFNYLHRVDRLSRLGQFAVLLIGFRDGMELDKPVASIKGIDDIIYLIPFAENNIHIQEYDTDTTSPRYGMPTSYKLQTGGYGYYAQGRGASLPAKTILVHHSRVLHVAEGLLENEVFGIPVLQAVLNRLDDLDKVVGGAAEVYWLNGRGGLNLNVDKDAQLTNAKELEKHAEDYIHQLSRILKTQGIDVRTLEHSIHDPHNHVSVILDLIAGTTGIPKRILIGSERGELASSQDESNWNNRVRERSVNYCEPFILRPIIKKFMEVGALPTVDDFIIQWPPAISLSEKEKAETNLKRTQAIASYVNAVGSDLLIPPEQFVKEVLGMKYQSDKLAEIIKMDRAGEDEVDEMDEMDEAAG